MLNKITALWASRQTLDHTAEPLMQDQHVDSNTVSVPMTRLAITSYNKYSSLINTEAAHRPERHLTFYEHLFGREKTAFDIEKDRFFAKLTGE